MLRRDAFPRRKMCQKCVCGLGELLALPLQPARWIVAADETAAGSCVY